MTGSSKGLGFASAKALIAEGCRVVICARTPDALQEARRRLAEIGGEDHVVAVAADVSSEEGAQKVVDRAITTFGGIDILVNNVATARGGGLLDTTDELWTEAVDQTLMPSVRVSRLAVPHMQRRGGGSIVIIASIYGREAGGRMTYNAVKAAEISLAKSLAQQLAPMNIRVNSVSPGSILFEGGSWWKRQQADPAGRHDAVVNLQGDLPTVEPQAIRAVLAPLEDPAVDIGTIVTLINSAEERDNPNMVKAAVAFAESPVGAPAVGRALYFSRLTVPEGEGPHYHHIGIYAYRRAALARFVALPPGGLEKRERLEQLRALEAGMRIDAALVDSAPFGVDTPADLARARAILSPA